MSSDNILPPNITEDTKAKAMDAAANSFTNPSVQNALKLDLEKFTANAKQLEGLFDTVYRDLQGFDTKKLSAPLAPTWLTYKTRYRKQLWDSRDLATEIATGCEQFSTAIIPLATSVENTGSNSEASKQYLKEVTDSLVFYIDQNKINTEKAKAQADGFNALKADVKAFSDNFEKFGDGLLQQNQAEIKNLESSIAAARTALDDVNKKVIAAGIALGLSLLVTAALIFIPVVGWAAVGVGVAAVAGSAAALGVFESQAKKLRDQISTETKRKAELEDQNQQILKIRDALKRMKTDKVDHIVNGLGYFEEIWNGVNSDCVSIKKYLDDILAASGKPVPMPLIMVMYLKNANTLYIGLAKALRDYSVGLVNAGVTQP
jgi:predicted  nucleic acid-binding Zn-ribbon protein